jgi:hypothetical protein
VIQTVVGAEVTLTANFERSAVDTSLKGAILAQTDIVIHKEGNVFTYCACLQCLTEDTAN